jgi:diacylglycerol kinase (ATP)
MTKAVVITNPTASRASRGLKRALARLRAGGLAVEVVPTTEPGHGADLALAAIAAGADLIVAHGGDGTIMDVAPALAQTGRPLGILPAGTGNRLADNLDIPWTPEQAADVIVAGRWRAVDLGRMTTTGGVRHFAVAAGCGFDAEIMHRTRPRTKRTFGIGAYLASAVGLAMDLPRGHVRVDIDGVVFEREAVTVLLANCGVIIPTGRKFAEQIHLDDGFLDVFILDAATFAGAVRLAWLLATGRATGEKGVTVGRGRCIRVTTEPSMAAQADGDPWGRAPLTAELLAGALHVLAPAAR